MTQCLFACDVPPNSSGDINTSLRWIDIYPIKLNPISPVPAEFMIIQV